MMQTFFKGMHVEIAADVDGRLVKTSSPYVQSNKVTLLEIDFDRLMSNPGVFDQLGSAIGTGHVDGRSPREAEGRQGVKVNDPVVTIENLVGSKVRGS
jgi:hypothetical protein